VTRIRDEDGEDGEEERKGFDFGKTTSYSFALQRTIGRPGTALVDDGDTEPGDVGPNPWQPQPPPRILKEYSANPGTIRPSVQPNTF
jgi:hypothetical protein